MPDAPRLLDLFCGAGGAAMGYSRAGFDVVGVDIAPQPNYPFEFYKGDALRYLANWDEGIRDHYDAIHASPPCQAFTPYRRTGNVGEYPDLVAATRDLLDATSLPYVIENVESAPLLYPVVICGTMFDPPMEVQRHRIFETNWTLDPPMWPCRHKLNGRDRYPGGRSKARTGHSRGLDTGGAGARRVGAHGPREYDAADGAREVVGREQHRRHERLDVHEPLAPGAAPGGSSVAPTQPERHHMTLAAELESDHGPFASVKPGDEFGDLIADAYDHLVGKHNDDLYQHFNDVACASRATTYDGWLAELQAVAAIYRTEGP